MAEDVGAITITIDENVTAKLKQMEGGLAGRSLLMALEAGGLLIQNRWKELAPYRTGTYRRSIAMYDKTAGRDSAELIIGTNIIDPPYPFFLEYGTKFMVPHPSAEPAFEQQKNAAAREVKATITQLMGLA